MPSGAIQQKGYDQGGRLTSISFASGPNAPAPTGNYGYGYNALSLRTQDADIKRAVDLSKPKDKDIQDDQWSDGDPCSKIRNNIGEK